MKEWADKKRRDITFEIGDLVFLKLQPYGKQFLAQRPCDKLVARFYGPFEITEKIGAVAYKLLLPEESMIHPVFHVSQLKLAKGATFNPTAIPELLASLELVVMPEKVLALRNDPGLLVTASEVLIKWHGLPDSEATWERYSNILTLFPEFHLEDKVSLVGAGIFMDRGRPSP